MNKKFYQHKFFFCLCSGTVISVTLLGLNIDTMDHGSSQGTEKSINLAFTRFQLGSVLVDNFLSRGNTALCLCL